jgi:hypothetical protein
MGWVVCPVQPKMCASGPREVRFVYGQEVDAAVAAILRRARAQCLNGGQRGVERGCEELTMYGDESSAALVTDAIEFCRRSRRSVIGKHVRLHCSETPPQTSSGTYRGAGRRTAHPQVFGGRTHRGVASQKLASSSSVAQAAMRSTTARPEGVD